MKEYVKKVLLKAMKLQGIESEVSALKIDSKKSAKKLAQLKKDVANNKRKVKILTLELSIIRTRVWEMAEFLYETDMEKYYVQHGHDPKGERCDICKGRELGIFDYRKDLLSASANIWSRTEKEYNNVREIEDTIRN